MTNAARSEIFSRWRFAARRVAGVTLVMGRNAAGNREPRRASTPAMTGCTATRRPGSARHVLSVIEFDVEAFIKLRGETFERRVAAVDVRVADDAHRHAGSYKLPLMTTDTSFVSGKNRRCRIVFALVTSGAGERRVTLALVFEV